MPLSHLILETIASRKTCESIESTLFTAMDGASFLVPAPTNCSAGRVSVQNGDASAVALCRGANQQESMPQQLTG